MEYAVRGPIVVAADEITRDLESTTTDIDKKNKYPFDRIVYANIGNPHAVGQEPLTWPRQVLALVDLPRNVGVNHPHVQDLFPPDVIARAAEIQDALQHSCGGSTGAYSHSQGLPLLRQHVAQFIQERDGGVVAADPELIFLTNGASSAIHMMLQAIISTDPNVKTGVMIPIPQYPIYSATLDLLQGHAVGYYLDEEAGWALSLEELERSYQQAVADNVTVAAMVLINPGNPTGQVLTPENVRTVVQFCAKHNLVLMADEVYQENVYRKEDTFYSCKRAAHDCRLLKTDDENSNSKSIELVSFHSVSKGVFGECGRRGGYMELTGIDSDVVAALYKLASSSLCATVSGQIMVSLMVQGPRPGDASYEMHQAEQRHVYESLQRKAALLSAGLNAIPNMSCQPAAGAMYCFPRIHYMPPKLLSHASATNQSPDSLYCLSLLKATGICVVPASGFVQRPGRFGFRITCLPDEAELERCVAKIAQHYKDFCQEWEA